MNDIQKLRYWTFKILPLVYDDSLSYYEVLAKVTAKLNEIVENVNEIPNDITTEISNQLNSTYATNIAASVKEQVDVLTEESQQTIENLANSVIAGIVKAIATDEGTATYTASAKTGGELIWLNNTLYEVVAPMAVGTNYVVNSNISEVVLSDYLNHMKGYLSDNNEFYAERSSHDYDTGVYLYWKDNLYITTADIKVNDILYDGGDSQNLKEVTLGEEISSHYLEMHNADNNLQTQIDGNDGDIEALQNKDIDLQNQITTNNTNVNNRISNIVAQAGNDNTEIVDARSVNNITFNSLHDIINAIFNYTYNGYFKDPLATLGYTKIADITTCGLYVSGNNLSDYEDAPYSTNAPFILFYNKVKEQRADVEYPLYIIYDIYNNTISIKYSTFNWKVLYGATPEGTEGNTLSFNSDYTKLAFNHSLPTGDSFKIEYSITDNNYDTISYGNFSKIINDNSSRQIITGTTDNPVDVLTVEYGTNRTTTAYNGSNYTNLPNNFTHDIGFFIRRDYTDVGDIYWLLDTIGNVYIKSNSLFSNWLHIVSNVQSTNLKYFAIGDSITAGVYSYNNAGTSAFAYSTDGYAFILARLKKYDLTNLAIQGYTWKDCKEKVLTDSLDLTRANIITVMLGTNDYQMSTIDLGTETDDVTAETEYGYIKYCLTTIMSKAPNSRLKVITPINCAKFGDSSTNYGWGAANGKGITLKQIHDAIVYCCTLYAIPYTDMTLNSETFNFLNLPNLLPDSLHPSLQGHRSMAEELANKI